MKVLHTISSMGVQSGGTTSCTYYLLQGLVRQGVDVNVLSYALREGDKYPGEADFYRTVPRTGNKLLYSKSFYEYMQSHPVYDIYHSNGLWQYPSHATAVYAHKMHKPYIMTPHGMLYPEALSRSKWIKKAYTCLWQHADLHRASCIQATCMKELEVIREYGLKNPVAIIPNSVNVGNSNVSIKENNSAVFRIGYVGRLHPYKQVERIIIAISLLPQEQRERIELCIVGGGDVEYENYLKSLTIQYNLTEIVRFCGFVTGIEKEKLIDTFSVVCIVSKSENFGMVIAEALVRGIPVMASKGTPWEDLNTHRCGWWVDNDVDTIASAMRAAIELPEEERRAMGERGRQLIVNHYSVDVVAAQMKAVYEWLMGGVKPDCVYE